MKKEIKEIIETSGLSVTSSAFESSEKENNNSPFGEPSDFWDYGVICEHDDGYACEHRLDALKKYARKI